MPIQLSDDGTMDTVLKCSECGEEFRYTFDGADEANYLAEELTNGKPYRDFVAWAIDDASDSHECIETPSTVHTPVTAENYFEAAQALYWFCTHHHAGQNSELYSIMSARLDYHPGMGESGPEEESEAFDFYRELVGGGWDATEMLDAINAAYKEAH